MPVNMGQ